MAEVEVPLVGAEIDSEDYSGSAEQFGLGTLAMILFFAMVAIASYGFDRIKTAAGVDDDGDNVEIPGV
jgi:hypothetical protein